MSESAALQEFDNNHPYPDAVGLKSLFKFYTVSQSKTQHLRDLFVDGKLYHALPRQFNDPFECKPNIRWPTSPDELSSLGEHIFKEARARGSTATEARQTVSIIMSEPKVSEGRVTNSIRKTFNEVRICSFTNCKKNLLLWSYYTNSHEGICVEFDAEKMPISSAYKVNYSDEYPEIIYPTPRDRRVLTPALTKSNVWKHESEFRTIFTPEAPNQPNNDGQSLLLEGNEIKNIFFGAEMNDSEKENLIRLIKDGPFSPSFWNTSLSRSRFKLEFEVRP